ncbi:hypothetical protein [Yersinia pestis]|uniref:hypothetical protein n=1 Tax=Yersinia pestis TaxID=632 RepID=UPI000A8F7CE2|nr:hypothetical protein [Yersinia pestis]
MLSLAPLRGGVTNRSFSKHVGVTEATIRNWRKAHPEFDRAFTEPERMMGEKINNGIQGLLGTRTKTTKIKGAEGTKTITEEVLPSHNDIMVAAKSGFRKSMIGFEEQHRKETLKGIRQRLAAGEITYLDAVDECEEEGITVPDSWKTREIARIIGLKEAKDLDAVQTVLRLEAAGLEVPKLLMLEAQKSLGVVDSDAVQPAIIKIVSPGAYRDDSSD